MATQLIAFTNDQIDVIYKATHLTETLNKKLATALPTGIYRGFNLSSDEATTDQIQITADPSGDGHIAVIENDEDRSITIRRSGGTFTLDISSLRNAALRKYAIAVWGQYSKGSTTGAAIRAYETYPTNELLTAPEAGTLAILGEITLQAGVTPAIVPLSDISQARRVSAWQQMAPEHGLWKPLLQNGNFEVGDTSPTFTYAAYGWRLSDGSSLLNLSAADSRTGSKCLNWTAVSLTSLTFRADQYIGEPVTPTAQVRVRGFYKVLQTASAGEVEVVLTFADSTGATGSHDVRYVIMDSNSVVSSDWEEFGAIVAPPAGATQLVSFHLECDDTVMDVSSVSGIIRFDDWQVWKSWNGAEQQNAGRVGDMADISPRALIFPIAPYSDRTDAPLIQRSVATLLGEKTIDVATGNFRARNSLGVGDDLVQTLSEAATARLVLPHRATNSVSDGDTFTLLLESLPDTGTEASVRYYSDDVGNLIFTHNAKYTSLDTWTRDETDLNATMTLIGTKDGLTVLHREADESATFTSSSWRDYLHYRASHNDGATEWEDILSLWEYDPPIISASPPLTGTFTSGSSGDGSTGWVGFGSIGFEASEPSSQNLGKYAYVENRGWYRVKAVGGNGSNGQLQLADIETDTAANFGTTGSETVRLYKRVSLGSPRGKTLKGLYIDSDWNDGTDDAIRLEGQVPEEPLFRLDSTGKTIAKAYGYSDNSTISMPLASWQPANQDWDLTSVSSAAKMAYSAVGAGDLLVWSPMRFDSGTTLEYVSVRVQPSAAGAMTLTVKNYAGTTLGTPDTSTGTSEQTLSVSGLTEVYNFATPFRVYITSGQASDLVYYGYFGATG